MLHDVSTGIMKDNHATRGQHRHPMMDINTNTKGQIMVDNHATRGMY